MTCTASYAASKKSFKRPILFLALAALMHLLLILPLVSLLITHDESADGGERLLVNLWPPTEAAQAPQDPLDKYDDERTVVNVADSTKGAEKNTGTKYYSKRGSHAETETRARDLGRRRELFAENAAPDLPPAPQEPAREHSPATEPSPKNDIQIPAPVPPTETTPLKITPDETVFKNAVAGSGLADLRELLEGDETSLNSAAFRHAPFFQRVQHMVEQFWHPDVAIRKNDPETKIIGSKDRVTTLLVVLNRDGSLKKVYTMHPSGAGFLDDEASDAVKNAAPFPNVPASLVGVEDKLVKFLFQFTVEINRRPAIRIRRYE